MDDMGILRGWSDMGQFPGSNAGDSVMKRKKDLHGPLII